MGEDKVGAVHSLVLKGRDSLHLDGVLQVISFDDASVILETHLGTLTVGGESLCVKKLDSERGEVLIDGRICAMIYLDEGSDGKSGTRRKSGRLFR